MKRLLCLCGLLLLLCGCTAEITAEQREIIDEYAALTLDLDGDLTIYASALNQVGAYLDNPDTLDRALVAVYDAQDQLGQREYSTYTISPEMFQLLENNDNEIIDMETQAAHRTMKIADYQSTLNLLQFYLEQATMTDMFASELAYQYYLSQIGVEIERSFGYTAINYMFAPWDTDYMPYLEETLLGKLKSYAVQDYQWETDRDVIKAFGDGYLADLEANLMDYESYLGSQQALLYEEQAAIDP